MSGDIAVTTGHRPAPKTKTPRSPKRRTGRKFRLNKRTSLGGSHVGQLAGGSLHGRDAIDEVADGVPSAVDEGVAGGVALGDLDLLVAETDFERGDIDGDFDVRVGLDRGRHLGDVLAGGVHAGDAERGAVAEKDL